MGMVEDGLIIGVLIRLHIMSLGLTGYFIHVVLHGTAHWEDGFFYIYPLCSECNMNKHAQYLFRNLDQDASNASRWTKSSSLTEQTSF